MFLRFMRALMGAEDAVGAGAAPAPAPAADTSAVATADALAKEKARAEELQKRLDAQTETDRKAKEAEKRKKADAEGKTKELADQLTVELEAQRKQTAALEKTITDRAEASLARLSDGVRARLKEYKEKVPLDVWVNLVDDAITDATDETKHAVAPIGGGGLVSSDRHKPGYEPTRATVDFLKSANHPNAIAMLKTLETVEDPERPGRKKFRKPIDRFFADAQKYQSVNVRVANAMKPTK